MLFTLAIKGTTYLLFGMSPSNLRYILVPTLMSLVTGFLLAKFFPEARGSGVPQTEAAYHLYQGHVPGRVAFGKFLTGVLCIGSGHSMGQRGPFGADRRRYCLLNREVVSICRPPAPKV